MGPKVSPKFELVGEDIGDVKFDPRGLSPVIALSNAGVWCCSCDRSNDGRVESWEEVWRLSSLNFAITEPDPRFGPLFLRTISLVHLRPADTHLSQGLVLEHRTLRLRHASHGRRESGVAGKAV